MNIVIVGTREEGKTTLAMALLRSRYLGVVAFDPRGMIDGHVVWDEGELEHAIEQNLYRDGLPIVYRFDSTDTDEQFSIFSAVLFPPRFTRGGFGVLVDESGLLQGANSINQHLFRIVKQHPTKPPEQSVAICQTTHVLSEIYGKTRSLINVYYIFQLTAPNDLKAIREITGVPELEEVIKNLPQHHCVEFINARVPEGVSKWRVIDDPEVWHIPATVQDEKNNLTSIQGSDTPWDVERYRRTYGG